MPFDRDGRGWAHRKRKTARTTGTQSVFHDYSDGRKVLTFESAADVLRSNLVTLLGWSVLIETLLFRMLKEKPQPRRPRRYRKERRRVSVGRGENSSRDFGRFIEKVRNLG